MKSASLKLKLVNHVGEASSIVEIRSLKKKFGKLKVLKGIDLNIERGKTTAIIGHNGSGKTTLIKTILGLTKADEGSIELDGITINGDSDYRSKIGYMPQLAFFPDNLKGSDVLKMLCDLRGEEVETDTKLIDQFDLKPELEKPIRTLSGGTRQKISAVIAFMFKPELLILDEPSAGLDPIANSLMKDVIQAEKEEGKSFLISSHIMSEIEELADNIAMLIDGKIHFQGSIQSLLTKSKHNKLERAVAQIMQEED